MLLTCWSRYTYDLCLCAGHGVVGCPEAGGAAGELPYRGHGGGPGDGQVHPDTQEAQAHRGALQDIQEDCLHQGEDDN